MKKILITVLGFALLPMLFACRKSSEESSGIGDEFKLLAIVRGFGERLEVEIIESDYAFGEYWVIVAPETEILDKSERKIKLSDIPVGARVEISYGGQVMMSYPPQIVAARIKIAD